MRKSIIRVATYSLLIGLAISFLMVFLPRTYSVPAMQMWADTQYWQLQTGSRIAFTRIAAKAKKKPYPIIYLHGGPGGHVRDGLIESLAPLAQEGYDLYFYDQIGSGLSDRLSDITEYTVERHIRDLAAITEKLGGGKVILIGQSWGQFWQHFLWQGFPKKHIVWY